ncbi:hypothetical protein VCR6J2_30066 [Vibrio coralliirubri]|nr:hypothetical protein VCR6J2_30066 [Vibrio coralliirubri]
MNTLLKMVTNRKFGLFRSGIQEHSEIVFERICLALKQKRLMLAHQPFNQ